MVRNRLLSKQLYYEKVNDHNNQGLLLHLPRFFRMFKPKAMQIVDRVVEVLKRQPPPGLLEFSRVQQLFDDDMVQAVRKVFKMPMLHQFVNTDVVRGYAKSPKLMTLRLNHYKS